MIICIIVCTYMLLLSTFMYIFIVFYYLQYAAWNEISFSNYVTANVRIVSHSRMLFVVEYLGPEKSEIVEK